MAHPDATEAILPRAISGRSGVGGGKEFIGHPTEGRDDNDDRGLAGRLLHDGDHAADAISISDRTPTELENAGWGGTDPNGRRPGWGRVGPGRG